MPAPTETSALAAPETLAWKSGVAGALRIIDQTLLPAEFREIDLTTVEQVWEAIRSLRIRGAPAIGAAAAFGVVIGARDAAGLDRAAFDRRLNEVCEKLASSRPTAVNLFWAIQRMGRHAAAHANASAGDVIKLLLEEAQAIAAEDRAMCRAIGEHGAALLPHRCVVLTHCNAGSLATAGDGTALAVIYAAVAAGKEIEVFADETRPLLQGARLTAWELSRRKIPVTVLCDSAAGWLMKEGKIDAVITGADRIAANGDAANKIGTYSVAVLARAHGIPFYIAAPSSTFDLSLADGGAIPIEERSANEVTEPFGRRIAPENVAVRNPAFDVTPADLISALITEKGVIRQVDREHVREALDS